MQREASPSREYSNRAGAGLCANFLAPLVSNSTSQPGPSSFHIGFLYQLLGWKLTAPVFYFVSTLLILFPSLVEQVSRLIRVCSSQMRADPSVSSLPAYKLQTCTVRWFVVYINVY